MKAQYVTNDKGKKVAVILPLKEYEKMIATLEDIEDVRLYNKAMARKQEFIPAAEAFKTAERKRKRA